MALKTPRTAPVSLRETQKLERRQTILAAADALILEKGYEGATVEEIAARARLSPPTVYNYFGSKIDLLIALYQEDREIALAKMDEVMKRDWPQPIDLLMALFQADFHNEVASLNRALWRQVAATETIAGDTQQGQAFERYNNRVIAVFRAALEKCVAGGQMKGGIDCGLGADLVFAVNDNIFRRIIMTEEKKFTHFRAPARRMLAVVIAGLG